MRHIVCFLRIFGILLNLLILISAFHQFNDIIDSDENHNNNNKAGIQDNRKLLIQKVFQKVICPTDPLNIYIRTDYLQKDIYNPSIFWLQHCCLYGVTLNTYNPQTLLPLDKLLPAPSGEVYVIVSEVKYFHAIVFHYAQRAATYFFIFDEPIMTSEENVIDSLNLIWKKRKVVNIYVISPEGIYFYDPFAVYSHEDNYGKLVAYNGDEHIHKLIFGNMRGYPIKVQFFNAVYAVIQIEPVTGNLLKLTGVDGEALKMLKELLNFTIILNKPNVYLYGHQLRNGSFNGALGEIAREECDLCASGFFVKDYKAPFMEFTLPVYGDRVCVYSAKAQKVPLSILPIYVMGKSVEIFIIAGFAFGGIICAFRYINERLYKLTTHKSIFQRYVFIFIDTWVVWVRRPILHVPPYRSERIFLTAIALLSVIFGVIFESALSTAYIKPFYYADLKTLKDLDDSGMEIIYKFPSFADVFFSVNESQLLGSLNRKMRYVNNLKTSLLNYTKQHPHQVTSISRYSALRLDDLQEIIENRIWIVPECPQYYSIAYILQKKSPFANAINFQLQYILSAGFFKYWENCMHITASTRLTYIKSKIAVPIEKSLNINDLQLSMYVLLIGHLLSILVFSFEVLIKRY